jgi:hypothetical protein
MTTEEKVFSDELYREQVYHEMDGGYNHTRGCIKAVVFFIVLLAGCLGLCVYVLMNVKP